MGHSPFSGVGFPSPNAIKWVADPQVVCRFVPLLRLGGSPVPGLLGLANGLATLCVGWSVDLPDIALFGGSKTNALRAMRGSRTLAAVCTLWTVVKMWSIFTQLKS